MFKKVLFTLASALIGLSRLSSASAATFDNIQFWVGTGTNRAAFEVDWNDGTPNAAQVWGYRWNGPATGEQMFNAIAAADPRLYAEVSGNTAFGTALFGLGFHPAGDQNFLLSPDLPLLTFNRSHLAYADYSTVEDSRGPVTPGDLWEEGWYMGYWSYWTSTDSRLSQSITDWDYSGVGMSGRELADGDWDGWGFAPGFNGVTPADPAAATVLQPASLDDVQFWTGAGTNRAALVIHWSAPEIRNNTEVPNPAAEKSLVWGYRFNGAATAEDMFNAIVAADHRLFVAATPPYPGFGAFIYSIGYDLNNNGVFGIVTGTNVLAENAFTNGQYVVDAEDPDNMQPLDAGDLFWSGSLGANWEMWQEHNGTGGFAQVPDRGPDPYWTPTDTTYFSAGSHGQWDYAGNGLEGTSIQNGSWIGFTVAAGGFNYSDANDPGTVAYDYHKHAPVAPAAATTNSTYVVQVISSQGPFGPAPYNDPTCITGAPATRFFESGSQPATRVKLVEPAYNVSVANGATNTLIVTLKTGSSIIAKFNRPVYDNPAHPYGIDFEVFGNAFYTGNGFSSDAANMNTYLLTTGGFYEPTKVSVSPGYTGQAGQDPNDPSTWAWYRYDNGPYDDTDCPTEAYKWNRAGAAWTDQLMDFTKPVNPALKAGLNTSGSTLSAADAIDLYDGSGGGTGFDLKPSGFAWIQYVKVEGLSGFSGGEVDAFSAVRPMTIGDTLSIAPANVATNAVELFFQQPGAENQNALSLNFTNVSDIAQIKTARLDDPAMLAAVLGTPLDALQLSLAAILNTNAVTFQADLGLFAGANYTGNGNDLYVAQWTGTGWQPQPFTFNPLNNEVVVTAITNLSAFVVSQIIPPQLTIQSRPAGFTLQFTPVANCPQILERSTDLVTWTPLQTFTPTNAATMTWQDANVPAAQAFYRLHLVIP